MVANRITVNQKVMFSAFNRKLTSAELNRARITGNVDDQRRVQMRRAQGTRYGLSPEEEDVLRAIWKSGSERCAEAGVQTSTLPTTSASNEKLTASFNSNSSSNSVVNTPKRVKPTSAVTPRTCAAARTAARSKSAAVLTRMGTGSVRNARERRHVTIKTPTAEDELVGIDVIDGGSSLGFSSDSKSESGDEINSMTSSSHHLHPLGRSMTFTEALSEQDKRKLEMRQRMRRQNSLISHKPCASSPPEPPLAERSPSLLDIHRKRVADSKLTARMTSLLASMNDLSHDKARIDRDHYTHAVDAIARSGWGSREPSSVTQKLERSETIRLNHVPSLTVQSTQPGPLRRAVTSVVNRPMQKVHFA